MLTAYFDDSGTHISSDIVLLGGLIGDEGQWSNFSPSWKARLDQPVPHRGKIKKFHMAECEAGEGAFSRWSRAERDLAIHGFRQIILDCRLNGFVFGVARHDWDELVTGKQRVALGDAERFCVMRCMLQTVEAALQRSSDKSFALVFDQRGERDRVHRRTYEIFELAFRFAPQMGTAHGVSFLSSEDAVPLQAADLVAWESYQLFKSYARKGAKIPARPHLLRLIEGNQFECMFLQREEIREIAAKSIHDDAWFLFSRQFC